MSVSLSLSLGKSHMLKPTFLAEKNIQVVAWFIAHVLYLKFLPVIRIPLCGFMNLLIKNIIPTSNMRLRDCNVNRVEKIHSISQ